MGKEQACRVLNHDGLLVGLVVRLFDGLEMSFSNCADSIDRLFKIGGRDLQFIVAVKLFNL